MHVLVYLEITRDLFDSCRRKLNPGGTLLVFGTDPRHIGDPELEAGLRAPLSITFTSERFMRRVARDFGFDYEYLPCRGEPQCCFHLLKSPAK
jgi:hypothetical protein